MQYYPRPQKWGFMQEKKLMNIWISNYYYLDGTNFLQFSDDQVFILIHKTHYPQQIIDLTDCLVDGVWDIDGVYQFCLRNTRDSDLTMSFGLFSLQEAEEWVAQLKLAIQLCNQRVPTQMSDIRDFAQDDVMPDINHFYDKNWVLKINTKLLKIYESSDSHWTYLKGEFILLCSFVKLKEFMENEANFKHIDLYRKSCQQHGDHYMSESIYNQKSIHWKFHKQFYIQKDKFIFIKDSSERIEVFVCGCDSTNRQKCYCSLFIQCHKADINYNIECIKNYLILHYEMDVIFNQMQQPKLPRQSTLDIQQSENQYFIPQDRKHYSDPNKSDHVAFKFHKEHDRVNTLTAGEMETLNAFRLMMDYLGLNDNTLIRHLQARAFNLEAAAQMLEGVVEWRKQGNCNFTEDQFPIFIQKNIHFLLGEGHMGNPIFYINVQNMLPGDFQETGDYTLKKYCQFFIATVERSLKSMRGNCDSQILIIDCYNFGRQNVSLDLIKALMAEIFLRYPERQCRNIVLNTNFLTKTIYNMIKGFLPPRTVAKMAFATSDIKDIQSVLLKDMPLEVIPRRYGGMNDLVK